MKLNYRKLGKGEPLFILHGVFGSSDNWQTLGKVFSEKNQVFLIDLRNHGKSPHDDMFNYEVMVADLLELMRDEQLERANILGHSMGGKAAMYLATNFPEKVNKLIVVDIAPKFYPPHHQQIFAGFHAVKLDEIKSRKEADVQMATAINNSGIRQFILKNLGRDENNNFAWKLNLKAIENSIGEVGGSSIDGKFEGKTLFIDGEKSNYIQKTDELLIFSMFPNAKIIPIAGAGHWVHAEQPKLLSEAVLNFLD